MGLIPYMSPTEAVRRMQVARMHLQVWQWVFYGLAAVAGAGAIAMTLSVYLRFGDWLGAAIVFGVLATGALVCGAMGMRCRDSRDALSAGNRGRYEWAVQAFSAMLVFSVPLALLGVVCVVAMGAERGVWFMLPAVSGTLTIPGLVLWSCHRVHAAADLGAPGDCAGPPRPSRGLEGRAKGRRFPWGRVRGRIRGTRGGC
jgi:hypothetical protein